MRRPKRPQRQKFCRKCHSALLRYADKCVDCGWAPWYRRQDVIYLLIAFALGLGIMLFLTFNGIDITAKHQHADNR